MNSPKKLKIAARHSDLARLQAYRVGDKLKEKFPGIEIAYSFRASLGDQNLEDPLWKMPEKGVFTEDFVRDLHEGTADLVVHSWKDLPTEPRPGLSIAATLPRADQRDLFLMKRSHLESAKSAKRLRVLTSSPRRAFNLDGFFKNFLPFEIEDVSFENVRGNIPTRMKKLFSGEADALIVAKAAIDRLLEAPEDEFEGAREVVRETLRTTYQMVLPLTLNPTAAAQGALAVEIRSDRSDLAEILNAIHDHSTYEAVTHERMILSSYGGGCHQKIGISILDRAFGRVTFLQGLTDAGERLDRVTLDSEKPVSKAKSANAVYPLKEEAATFFAREDLPKNVWARAEKNAFLWVARETAWPQDLTVSPEVFVWTAGLTTWRKLAAKGIWVTGSTEGLGEQERESLGPISLAVLGKAPRWLKLTHELSASDDPAAVATYKLVPKSKDSGEVPNLENKTHFFWMSGSAFDRAAELFPSILSTGFHASGPGKTHEHLKSQLSKAGLAPAVFLNVDHFRRAVQP